jgi:hypothetical protein
MTSSGDAVDAGSYCRRIEAYLCQRNGGHLIRIVGPSFEMVQEWFGRGVPVRIVFQGIDRVLQRQQHRNVVRQRPRPLRIEFCEADVLEAFSEWKRALGSVVATAMPDTAREAGGAIDEDGAADRSHPSLPAHLQRAQLKLSSIAAARDIPEVLRTAVDAVLRDVDLWREQARSVRGERRQMLLERLRAADARLIETAWQAQTDGARATLETDAAADLAPFRERLAGDAWEASLAAAARRLLRERLRLPVLTLE